MQNICLCICLNGRVLFLYSDLLRMDKTSLIFSDTKFLNDFNTKKSLKGENTDLFIYFLLSFYLAR